MKTLSLFDKPLIGIDLGSATVKMAQRSANGYNKAVANVAGMFDGLELKDPAAFRSLLESMRKECKLQGKRCALVLSKRNVLVRRAELPYMEPKQMRDSMLMEFAGYLPNDTDEYLIDYRDLNMQPVAGPSSVMMAAVSRAPMVALLSVFKQAGFDVQYPDVCENVRAKIIHSIASEDNICFLDIGYQLAQFIIFHKGQYSWSKFVMGGGLTYTNALEQEMEMSFDEAEQYKQNIHMLDAKDAVTQQDSHAMRDRADALVVEVQRVLEYFRTNTQENVNRMYLLGGGAQLQGLPEYLRDALQMDIQWQGEWLESIDGDVRDNMIEDAMWTDAIGVMLREGDADK